MALNTAKYEAIHNRTGSDLTTIKANFDNGEHLKVMDFTPEAAIIYQIQKMQDELDYLRTEISLNKDKVSLEGPSTAISFGDMITTVTGKPPKTTTTYSIVMTVTKSGVTKSTTLLLK